MIKSKVIKLLTIGLSAHEQTRHLHSGVTHGIAAKKSQLYLESQDKDTLNNVALPSLKTKVIQVFIFVLINITTGILKQWKDETSQVL